MEAVHIKTEPIAIKMEPATAESGQCTEFEDECMAVGTGGSAVKSEPRTEINQAANVRNRGLRIKAEDHSLSNVGPSQQGEEDSTALSTDPIVVAMRNEPRLEICSKCKSVETHIRTKYRYLQTRQLVWGHSNEFCAIEITRFKSDLSLKNGGPATLARVVYDSNAGTITLWLEGMNGALLDRKANLNGDVDLVVLDEVLTWFTTEYVFCCGFSKNDLETTFGDSWRDSLSVGLSEEGSMYRSKKCLRWFSCRLFIARKMQNKLGKMRCQLCSEWRRGRRSGLKTTKTDMESHTETSSRCSISLLPRDKLITRYRNAKKKHLVVKRELEEMGALDKYMPPRKRGKRSGVAAGKKKKKAKRSSNAEPENIESASTFDVPPETAGTSKVKQTTAKKKNVRRSAVCQPKDLAAVLTSDDQLKKSEAASTTDEKPENIGTVGMKEANYCTTSGD